MSTTFKGFPCLCQHGSREHTPEGCVVDGCHCRGFWAKPIPPREDPFAALPAHSDTAGAT